MIKAVSFADDQSAIVVTMSDGSFWRDNAALPPDNELRRMLADWLDDGGVIAPYVAPPAAVPDGPTLSDWRVALIQMGRFVEVKTAIEAARDSGSAEGLIAWERFEYANHVYRAELLRLAPVMGFTEADIDQSLTVAAQIAAAAA